ncbi:MAG: biotin transporter BioY [Polyangiales bacterium]
MPRRALAVVAFAALMSLGARVTAPMVPVPMSLQSWAVLLAGVTLGARAGAASVALYLTLAALGLPVLAGGAHGLAPFRGATAGFLFAFAPVAALAGALSSRGSLRRPLPALAWMAALHALLLLVGAAWLARYVGPRRAIALGVTPFIPGALVKSALVVLAARATTLTTARSKLS